MLNNESKIVSIKKVSRIEQRYDLTVANSSRYFANGILVHNTDGQNIMITWKNGEVRAARNKSHLKNYGENSLSISDMDSLFAGRGAIQEAFVGAMTDLSNAIAGLSDKDKTQFFDEGKKLLA